MTTIAQTNNQLYNQLRHENRTVDELVVVHRAYQLSKTLYSGHYQADGKPFVAHAVGVASIVGHLDAPADIVAAGLLHNVYGNADFGDGLRRRITSRRRRLVRLAVGETIESLLVRFGSLRINRETISDIRRRLALLDETDRWLVLMDLADYLEKYVDLGVLYFQNNRWVTDFVADHGGELIAFAERLGAPQLGEMLSEAFQQAASASGDIADELRCHDVENFHLAVPRSCRRRLVPLLRRYLRAAWRQTTSWFPRRR